MREIFTYGTLMKGEPNHCLLARATFLREGATLFRYELRSRGMYPILTHVGVGAGTSVKGEVYLVDDATLADLDRLEGHPHHYRRLPIALTDGTTPEAYLQVAAAVEYLPVIPSGNWRDLSPYTKEA